MMVEPVTDSPKRLLDSYEVAALGDCVRRNVAGTATACAKPVEAPGYPVTAHPTANRQ